MSRSLARASLVLSRPRCGGCIPMSQSTKVTADHLRRLACLYVRQSSMQQARGGEGRRREGRPQRCGQKQCSVSGDESTVGGPAHPSPPVTGTARTQQEAAHNVPGRVGAVQVTNKIFR